MSDTDTSLNPSGISAIDQSLKAPVLVFLLSSAKWLVFATIFGYLAAWKSHNQAFLDSFSFLTTGRVQAAYTAILVYGFACNLAFGVAIWMMARLSGSEVRAGLTLIIAGAFWNIALTVGVVGILIGDLRAFEFLELPAYIAAPMAMASTLISIWGIMLFTNRTNKDVYASQWFIIAALFVFPWIQIVAKIMLGSDASSGVSQALVASWFAGNLTWLWFGAIAVAGLYYLIPKLSGSRLLSYSLSHIGFFALIFAGSWAGVARLVGGPFPSWIITAGIVASILMLIFFAITGINFVGTLWQSGANSENNDVLLFAKFASYALLISGIGATLLSLRGIAEVTQFTILLDAHRFLVIYGVFSMTAFGLVYYLVPQFMGRDWPMRFLISSHFWISFIGILLIVVPLAIGGWKQGSAMMDASIPFSEVVRKTSYYMAARSMGWIFLGVGHCAFILNLFSILKPDCDSCIEELTRTETEPVGGVES